MVVYETEELAVWHLVMVELTQPTDGAACDTKPSTVGKLDKIAVEIPLIIKTQSGNDVTISFLFGASINIISSHFDFLNFI